MNQNIAAIMKDFERRTRSRMENKQLKTGMLIMILLALTLTVLILTGVLS